MTDDRMAGVPADNLDARLARYLDWESAQLPGTPSGDEVALRIAGRAVQRRWAGSAVLAWAVLTIALLAVALAVVVAGGSNLLTVRPSASPRSADPVPSQTSPRIVAGTCGTGRTVITAAPSGTPVSEAAKALRAPEGGRLAIALEDQPTPSPPTGGSIVIAGPEAGSARVVATFIGDEILRNGGVGVFGWSASGGSLLVYAGSDDTLSGDRVCGNLWVVQADGSAVTRLTNNGPAQAIDLAAFSPGSTSVAYVQANVLHVLDLAGGEQTIPIGQCSLYGPHRLRWAPGERKILLVCDREVVVLDRDTGAARLLQARPHLLDAVWSPNGQSIVAATANDGGPVVILDIDAADGSTVTRSQGDHSAVWLSSSGTMSPDGRWLLVRGDADVPDSGDPTYRIETSTGQSTKLPWPVLGDSWFWNSLGGVPSATWLAGNDRVLDAQGEKLYEVDLRQLTRTEVGSVVPNQDWSVFMIPR